MTENQYYPNAQNLMLSAALALFPSIYPCQMLKKTFEKCTHVKLKTHALILFPALSRYPPTPPIKLPVSTWQHGKWTILKAIFTAALNWLSDQSFYIVSGMIWLGEIVSYPTFHLVLPLNQCILQ